MKAVIKCAPVEGAMMYADFADPPSPGPSEVLLRVTGAGICGTDVSIYRWREAVVGQYNPAFPVIVGHEFCGVVHEAGRDVALQPGTLVGVNPQVACGTCYYCRTGKATLCYDRKLMGGRIHGGWADYVLVPAANLQLLPQDTPADVAPLLEPLAVAVHAVCERVAPQPGARVAIIGAGPIGLLTLLMCRAAGVRDILVTGLANDGERLALARSLGAATVNVEEQDPVAQAHRLQHDGVDIVYETSGASSALDQAVQMVRRAGTVCLVGLCHAPSTLRSTPIVLREVSLVGSRGYNSATWDLVAKVLPLVAGDLPRLVSHHIPLREFESAIELVAKSAAIKIVLRP
jgi:2-desacetyl-2-hydroxyethyl bacteriochlorophyllide A dehydrogenase